MAGRKERINLRVDEDDRALFERAAAARENLTQFLVEGGRERAERVLADRTRFVLDEDACRKLVDVMDRPAEPRPELTELFSRPRPE